MISTVSELRGWQLAARDGDIGRISDVYFDDVKWAIRYFVVDTGSWLSGRKVLLSPVFARGLDSDEERLEVDISRQQVEDAPDIDADMPVSRQMESTYSSYYGIPPYWAYGYGGALWGWGPLPTSTIDPRIREDMIEREMREREARQASEADVHLRSAREITGYSIEARDGSIGHVDDFLFDDESWAIRHVVIDTRNWWPGRHVIVPPQRFREVNWADRSVWVDLTRDQVRSSPEFDSAAFSHHIPPAQPRRRPSTR